MQEKQIKVTSKNIYDLLLKFNLIKKETGVIDKAYEKIFGSADQNLFFVDGARQKYYLISPSKSIIKTGKVSTGKKGFGNKANSGKTSTRLMKVKKIIGKGVKKGTVFISRVPTDVVLGDHQKSPRKVKGKPHVAEVTTRIVLLTGADRARHNSPYTGPGDRHIYIHGTNRKNFLGSKASGGCVRVSNDDVIDLADNLLSEGDYVFIAEKTLYFPKDIKIYDKSNEL